MAVDVTLTENIRNAIIEAIRRNYLPRDLENQLSKYSEDRLSRNESDSKETRVRIIPFKLVKQLWEYQQLATTGQGTCTCNAIQCNAYLIDRSP